MRRNLQLVSSLLNFFLFGSILVNAQNLVPNPGFESYTTCPVGFSQYNGYVSNWISPNTGSPDYMNTCANPNPAGVPHNGIGYQFPHSGAAYSGMYASSGTIYREFIQVQLTSPLMAGQQYLFSMYVVLHNRSSSAVDDIGANFSVIAPSAGGTGMLSGNPQPQISNPPGNVITDTLNWTLISGTYTALGGERYLTLGHLKSDANTTYFSLPYGTMGAYYYYDDVSVTPVNLLPVSLSFFSADFVKSFSGTYVQLQWTTESEWNSCCFMIERSSDGQNFSAIGMVNSSTNSNTSHQYRFADQNPLPGSSFYRLRLQNTDESFSYSSAVSVVNDGTATSAYISNGIIIISNESDHNIIATIYSTEGKQIAVQIISPGKFEWKPSADLYELHLLLLHDANTGNAIYREKIWLN